MIRIQEIEPSTQFVHLEALRTLSSPISIEVEGQVATGYLATRPSLTPDQVTLEGPEPLLAEVTAVTGAISVEGAKGDLAEEVDVFPVTIDPQDAGSRDRQVVQRAAEHVLQGRVHHAVPGHGELALELLNRGHRLIADDAPEFARIAPDIVTGSCPPL